MLDEDSHSFFQWSFYYVLCPFAPQFNVWWSFFTPIYYLIKISVSENCDFYPSAFHSAHLRRVWLIVWSNHLLFAEYNTKITTFQFHPHCRQTSPNLFSYIIFSYLSWKIYTGLIPECHCLITRQHQTEQGAPDMGTECRKRITCLYLLTILLWVSDSCAANLPSSQMHTVTLAPEFMTLSCKVVFQPKWNATYSVAWGYSFSHAGIYITYSKICEVIILFVRFILPFLKFVRFLSASGRSLMKSSLG